MAECGGAPSQAELENVANDINSPLAYWQLCKHLKMEEDHIATSLDTVYSNKLDMVLQKMLQGFCGENSIERLQQILSNLDIHVTKGRKVLSISKDDIKSVVFLNFFVMICTEILST